MTSKNQHYEDFQKFFETKWMKPISVLSIVLQGHLYLEYLMDEILKLKIENMDKIKDFQFIQKVQLIEAFGPARTTIDAEYTDKLKIINKIRNKYSHNLDYNIPMNLIKQLSKERINLISWGKNPEVFIAGEISEIVGYLTAARINLVGIKNYKQKMSKIVTAEMIDEVKTVLERIKNRHQL